MQLEYLVLDYCPDVIAAFGEKIAVVSRPLHLDGGEGFSVYIAKTWPSQMASQEAEYIQAVLGDLHDASPEDRSQLFAAISEMSAGCLRTSDQGICEDTQLTVLMGETMIPYHT